MKESGQAHVQVYPRCGNTNGASRDGESNLGDIHHAPENVIDIAKTNSSSEDFS